MENFTNSAAVLPLCSIILGSIRRSVSCPRSISSQSPSSADSRPFSAQQMTPASRPTSGSRSHSLNRASSYMRHVPHTNDASFPNSQMVSHPFGPLRSQEALHSGFRWQRDRLGLRQIEFRILTTIQLMV